MCNAVLVTAKQLTPSAKLVDKLVSTVLSAFDPTEVRSTAGITNCSQVLLAIGKLASAGYMAGTLANTPTDYAELITLFTASLSTLTTNTAQITTPTTTKRVLIGTEYETGTENDHGLTGAIATIVTPKSKKAPAAAAASLSSNLQSATKSLVTGIHPLNHPLHPQSSDQFDR